MMGALTLLPFSVLLVAQSVAQQTNDPGPQRVPFQIATGTTAGTYFPVGGMLAGLLSHPPGIGRCETQNVCAPPGVIVSVVASEGSAANVKVVGRGDVSSGLAQADVVAQAVRLGNARHIRVIANLYPEAVHLVVRKGANIKSVNGLLGKRVSLSSRDSGTVYTARAVLSAYGLSEQSVRASYVSVEHASELMEKNELDAFFFVGGTPSQAITDLMARGVATLVPLQGRGRKTLIGRDKYLSALTIPANVYPGVPATETIGVGALWIVNDAQPEDRVYAMVKALYNPANRRLLDADPMGRLIQLPNAPKDAAATLHPGALRFYREVGLLPPAPAKPVSKS